ncbi:DUF3108 domain-containing protein [Taibaiella soli]|uniref:DUF3108 domain-containing protein n=1 Tax=Taibaiella soli TaxID=1649169 RepID=A0A2W2AHJ7_9BACT|nr:DUF3108 domain-containing protein [Taibaiella soli]PZF73022.1 DUF3108 domain-containing protein [Taibaiella soli]
MNWFLKISLAVCLCTMMTLPAIAQNEFCGLTNISFQEGEKLFFKVYYNMGRIWVGAGDASFTTTLETYNNRKVYHVVGDGRTQKSYEWFYKVRDIYETYIDAETMLPLKFVRNVNEGGFKIYNNVSFNHNIGQAVSTHGIYDVPKCVQDVLSAIYYARNIDYNKYQPGAKIPFSMFLDDQVYNLYIRYVGKEKIETRYGTFNAIKITPLLIEGTIFKGGEKMAVWVTDDNNHLPVRVDSPILVGSIKVDLIGYDKLRNPLTGLISKQ